MRRTLAAVLSLALAGGMVAVGGMAAAVEGTYLSSDLTLTPGTVHYVKGTRYDSSLSGSVTIDPATPCGGNCTLQIGIYAPGETNPWSVYQSSAAAGTTWPAVALGFTIYRTDRPTEGVHEVRVRVFDASDTELESLTVSSLTIYRTLSLAPSLDVRESKILEDRKLHMTAKVELQYADGYKVPYRGRRVDAYVQWSADGTSWRTKLHSSMDDDDRVDHYQVHAEATGLWRLRLTGDYPAGVSRSSRVLVWRQTDTIEITNQRIGPRSIYRGRSVEVRGGVVAKYTDGEWHRPTSDTRYQVLRRDADANKWRVIREDELNGTRLYERIKLRSDSFLKFRVQGTTSNTRRINVKDPYFDHVSVDWPRTIRLGSGAAFQTCAVSNVGTGLRGVQLILQWRATRLRTWTTLDVGQTSKSGCRWLFDPRSSLGYYRVYAPDFGKGKTQRYVPL